MAEKSSWSTAAGGRWVGGPAGEALILFVAPRNAAYLRACEGGAGATEAALRAFGAGRGRAALLGAPRPARDAWEGVRLLNAAFLEEGRRAAQEDEGPPEPYHIREFERDSLAPRGLGGLRDEGASAGVPARPPPATAEEAWEEGRAERGAEQALAEYYGEDWAASEVAVAAGPGRARAGLAPGHDRGARPVPFWQKAARGPRPAAPLPGAREFEGAARGWAGPGGRSWELR